MKVLVTGGAGRVGSAAVTWLVEKGYTVRIIDREQGYSPPPGVEYQTADINHYPSVREQVRGCSAIVHMAALASPASGSPDEVFHINAAGSFNIYRAAEEEGIGRVVQASSINALGLYYGVKNVEPFYFPIDEEHPPQNTDAYSFSKWIVEEIAEYYWRRSGISGISLRFPAVMRKDDNPRVKQRREKSRGLIERIAAMAEDTRQAWLDSALAELGQFRSQRLMENRDFLGKVYGGQSGMSEELLWLFSARSNFWSAIDERDAAQAVEKGLSSDYQGSHPLFVCDSRNTSGFESEMLARLFFPSVTARKQSMAGTESLLSIEKARKLIGFEPQISFTCP
jgi:nucleoside-diphosphate-sugar epimerase